MGMNSLIGKDKNGNTMWHGSEQTDKRRNRKGFEPTLPSKICSRLYPRLHRGSDVS